MLGVRGGTQGRSGPPGLGAGARWRSKRVAKSHRGGCLLSSRREGALSSEEVTPRDEGPEEETGRERGPGLDPGGLRVTPLCPGHHARSLWLHQLLRQLSL